MDKANQTSVSRRSASGKASTAALMTARSMRGDSGSGSEYQQFPVQSVGLALKEAMMPNFMKSIMVWLRKPSQDCPGLGNY